MDYLYERLQKVVWKDTPNTTVSEQGITSSEEEKEKEDRKKGDREGKKKGRR